MSRIANWGHWLVGAFFVLVGAFMLWQGLAGLPKAFQLLSHYPLYMTYIVLSEPLTWIAVLICGWGILRWQGWGRILGIVFSAYLLVIFAVGSIDVPSRFRTARVIWPLLLLALVSCSALVWLFLPGVRAEYLRRKRIA